MRSLAEVSLQGVLGQSQAHEGRLLRLLRAEFNGITSTTTVSNQVFPGGYTEVYWRWFPVFDRIEYGRADGSLSTANDPKGTET